MSNGVAVSESVSVKVTRQVRAKRPRVFDAWIKPEMMHLWFAPGVMKVASAIADARVGGPYRIVMEGEGQNRFVAKGIYTRIIPNELLAFTWGWEDTSSHDSVVTVTFHDLEGGTEVVLVHERLQTEDSRNRHEHGWIGCLENLALYLEQNPE